MISRRGFVLTPLVLAAQARRRRVILNFGAAEGNPGTVPPALAARSVVFPRAYTCCPQPQPARRALETGKFPRAIQTGDPTLEALLSSAGVTVTLADAVDAPEPDAILVFASAYGDGSNTPFEKSVKVPMAICAPGLLRPRTAVEIQISTVDLAPTLLALCGIAPHEDMQGRDLSTLLLAGDDPVKRTIELPDSLYLQGGIGLIGIGDEWRMVIRGFDKLAMDLSGTVTHLYNLIDDPEEQINLAEDPSAQLKRDALVALARTWMRKLGDGIDPSGLKRRP